MDGTMRELDERKWMAEKIKACHAFNFGLKIILLLTKKSIALTRYLNCLNLISLGSKNAGKSEETSTLFYQRY